MLTLHLKGENIIQYFYISGAVVCLLWCVRPYSCVHIELFWPIDVCSWTVFLFNPTLSHWLPLYFFFQTMEVDGYNQLSGYQQSSNNSLLCLTAERNPLWVNSKQQIFHFGVNSLKVCKICKMAPFGHSSEQTACPDRSYKLLLQGSSSWNWCHAWKPLWRPGWDQGVPSVPQSTMNWEKSKKTHF